MSGLGAAPAHLSPSQISTLLSCSEQYRLARILRAPSVPAWYFAGGSAVHRATELADLALYNEGRLLDQHELATLAMESFEECVEKDKQKEPDTSKWRTGGRGKSEGYVWWSEKVVEMTQAWAAWRDASELEIASLPDGTPAVEVPLNPVIGGQPFKLAIDRVLVEKTRTNGRRGRRLVVVDLKAGSREPVSPFQLVFYAKALQVMFDQTADYGYYWMARKGTLGSPHHLTPLIPMAEGMAETARKIIDLGLYMPNVTSLCGSCDVRPYCTAVGGDPGLLSLGEVS